MQQNDHWLTCCLFCLFQLILVCHESLQARPRDVIHSSAPLSGEYYNIVNFDLYIHAVFPTFGFSDTILCPVFRMAPEVIVCETFRDESYDSKVDVWSFGKLLFSSILFDCLCNKKPKLFSLSFLQTFDIISLLLTNVSNKTFIAIYC